MFMIFQDLVLKPLEIIDYFEPQNPQTGLLIADHEGCSCITWANDATNAMVDVKGPNRLKKTWP